MESPRRSTGRESKPKKLLPASAATTVLRQHKVKSNGSDERLQATNTRRKYMRRGSKTPSMLLMEASRTMDLLGNSLFPSQCGRRSDTNVSYHGLHTTALGMALAVDTLPESYLVDCRFNSKINSSTNNGTVDSLQSLINPSASLCDTSPTHQQFLHKLRNSGCYKQPRRLSVMSELKQHMELTSISNSTV